MIMRRSLEALVTGLRNRKRRIVAYSILSVVFLGLAAWQWYVLSDAVRFLLPKEGEDPVSRVVMGQAMMPGIAAMIAALFLLAAVIGVMIGLLITEAAMFTKSDLLVQLWDRVQALERSMKQTSGAVVKPQAV